MPEQPARAPLVYRAESDGILENEKSLVNIARNALEDNIERGGAAILEGRSVAVYEIENDPRSDHRNYGQFIRGDLSQLEQLKDRINSAVKIRSYCEPENAGVFADHAKALKASLCMLACQKFSGRDVLAYTTWQAYDWLVMHNLYFKKPETFRELSERGKVLWTFHTHMKGTPPSRQDLLISKKRREIVISTDETGAYTIYDVFDGKYTIIKTSTPDVFASSD